MTDRPESNDNELPSDDAEPELPPLGDLPPDDVPAPEDSVDEKTEIEIPPPPSPPGFDAPGAGAVEPPVPPGEPVATPPAADSPSPGMTPPPAAPPQPGMAASGAAPPQPGTTPPAAPPQPGIASPGAAPPGPAGTTPPAASPPGMGAAASAPGAAAAPGWYPAPGGQRYWDGQQWTEHAVAGATNPTSEYSTAMWAHLSALLISFVACGLGFIGPLVIMNGQGKQSAYVRHHAVEALNFSLTVLIAYIVSAVLMIIIIGFFLLPIIAIGALVLQIMASVAANRGEWYRYPVNIRFVK